MDNKKYILNFQDKTTNINQILPLTGINSIISVNSNCNLYQDAITGKIICDKSKIIIDNLSCVHTTAPSKIFATNNSLIAQCNGNLSDNLVNNANNSLFNFLSNKHTTYIPSLSLQYVTTIVNGKRKQLNEVLWNDLIVNDGNKFSWFTSNDMNNKIICDNIKNFQLTVDSTSTLTLSDVNGILSALPKNLLNHTLQINISKSFAQLNNNQLKIQNFYNGNVVLTLTYNNTTNTPNAMIFISNVQNLKIIDSAVKTYVTTPFIKIQNVKHCTIEDNTFEFVKTEKQLQYNKIDGIRYKEEAKEQFRNNILYGNLYINQSNVVIKDNSVSNIDMNFVFAEKNSTVMSYDNELTITPTSYNKRRILYYCCNNSICNASNEKISIEKNSIGIAPVFDKESDKSITGLQKQLASSGIKPENSYEYTFVYGYAYPGSFFNHHHQPYIKNNNIYKNKDLITNQLPIGSIFYVYKTISDNAINNEQYDADKHNTGFVPLSGKLINVGISYPGGYYQFSNKNQFNDDIRKFTSNITYSKIVQPIISKSTRYMSQNCQNVKFAKIYNFHFNINSSYYFNTGANSLRTALPVANEYYTITTNKYIPVIQYSAYLNINNKNHFHTNLQV